MPQFKRHKRLKRISSKQKFGVRYLHQHLFKDDPLSEDESVAGDSHHFVPQKTDGRLCFVRAITGLMLFAGLVLALVGGLVKRRVIDYRVRDAGYEKPAEDAAQYNAMLDALVLIGSVLIMLGGVMLGAVQILICYPRMKSGTHKPRVKDPEDFLLTEKTAESVIAAKKFDKVPVYALVHKVQPKKKSNETDLQPLTKQDFKTSIDGENDENN